MATFGELMQAKETLARREAHRQATRNMQRGHGFHRSNAKLARRPIGWQEWLTALVLRRKFFHAKPKAIPVALRPWLASNERYWTRCLGLDAQETARLQAETWRERAFTFDTQRAAKYLADLRAVTTGQQYEHLIKTTYLADLMARVLWEGSK